MRQINLSPAGQKMTRGGGGVKGLSAPVPPVRRVDLSSCGESGKYGADSKVRIKVGVVHRGRRLGHDGGIIHAREIGGANLQKPEVGIVTFGDQPRRDPLDVLFAARPKYFSGDIIVNRQCTPMAFCMRDRQKHIRCDSPRAGASARAALAVSVRLTVRTMHQIRLHGRPVLTAAFHSPDDVPRLGHADSCRQAVYQF